MKFLLVDDEVAALRNLENVLKNLKPMSEIYKTRVVDEALKICAEEEINVAFLDIQMPGKDGLTVAKEMKKINPAVNIVIVTAYKKYALDALRLFVSGYVLKPAMEEEVQEVLENLRNPLELQHEGLYIKCFGNFEVFYDGRPIKFKRSKAKEFLAYLIDRRGATVTTGEMCAILFGEAEENFERQRWHLHKVYNELRESLESVHCGEILNHSYNAYSVIVGKINCDYYAALNNPIPTPFNNEYMKQYSWAEASLGKIYLSALKKTT